MIIQSHPSVEDCFAHTVKEIKHHPAVGFDHFDQRFIDDLRVVEDDTSPDKDKPMLETEVMLHIANPRDRLIYSKAIDIFNCVGLWIYMLSGSEAVPPIEFYNPVARRFVDEGVEPTRLRATWGHRLFATGAVSRVIELLKTNPHTRRAVIPVFATEDVGYSSRNLPCLCLVQFSVKGGRLHCYVTMRSQALIGVMPYDLFILTMLHEYVAMQSNLLLGEYTHWAPLCGVRESEIHWLRTITEEHRCGISTPMLPMSKLGPGQLALFHWAERATRKGEEVSVNIPSYWNDFLQITAAKKTDNIHRIDYAYNSFPTDFILRAKKTYEDGKARQRA